MQGLLELADVAYVGPGVAASAVAMDKDLFKAVMRANDIPVTQSVTVLARARGRLEQPVRLPGRRQAGQARLERRDLDRPQPRRSSRRQSSSPSSTTRRCSSRSSCPGSRSSAACSATRSRSRPSSARSCRSQADWYDYASKYDEGGMELVVPARITARAGDPRAGARRARVRRLRLRGHGPGRHVRPTRTARCSSTS